MEPLARYNVGFGVLEKSIWAPEKFWKFVSEKRYKPWKGTNKLYHIEWFRLQSSQTGLHSVIEAYNMNEQKILAKNNQQKKKALIYETTDKQKKESEEKPIIIW